MYSQVKELSGQHRSLSGQRRASLRLTEDPIGPKKAVSDQNRVLSSRQRTIKRRLLGPIHGSFRPTKDVLRPPQNFKSNTAPKADKASFQATTGPPHADGEPSQANIEPSEVNTRSSQANGVRSWAERGSSQADRGTPSVPLRSMKVSLGPIKDALKTY